MRYHDMRALFAELLDGGRLTVHLAYRDGYPLAGSTAPADVPWTVIVRDNASWPLPGADIRYLYHVSERAHLARLDAGGAGDGLCLVDPTADPTCRLTCLEVLGVLDWVAESYPAWQVEAIVGTLEPQPHYGVTLRTKAGSPHHIASSLAFDRLRLAIGPLGPRGPLAQTSAGGRTLPWLDPAPRAVAAVSGGRDPFTALVFAPAGRARFSTLGGLEWLAQPSACTWLDLWEPSRDELLATARRLCIPYGAVLATLEPAPYSWCRAHRDHISVRMPVPLRDSVGGQIRPEPLDLIVGRTVVVSIHAQPLPALAGVRRRVGTEPDHVGMTAPDLVDAILDAMLTSDEALARWVAHDGAQAAGRTVCADPPSVERDARVLHYVVEAQHALLADADRLGRHLQGLALIPWWGEAEGRRRRLHAALRHVERLRRDDLASPDVPDPNAVSSQLAAATRAFSYLGSARCAFLGAALVCVVVLIAVVAARLLSLS